MTDQKTDHAICKATHMIRANVQPHMFRWARERAGLSVDALSKRFPKLPAWERGESQPTLKQLEAFANASRTPIGFLFLSEPPVEMMPIPDFRTVANVHVGRPSPDLLDTVYLCQQRQDWYRQYAQSMGEARLSFIGRFSATDDIAIAAAQISEALAFDLERRRRLPTWTEALREFIAQADALGILVMVSGVVRSNNHRRLDPEEFRGFAIADPVAPLVFINGADTKSAQMFTLAHELAHLWLGRSGVSDSNVVDAPEQDIERWCNRVAAELLVPINVIRDEYDPGNELWAELDRLSRRFKVSTLVVLRRIHDIGGLSWDELGLEYDREADRLASLPRSSGGDFYLSLPARVSRRLARAMVASTLEGRTGFTETFRLLGIRKMATFEELGRSLRVGY